MREGKFIDQNKERWQSYMDDAQDADELADRFSNLIDDLGYAKTFYPKSKTTLFINALSAKMFRNIYYKQKKEQGRMARFFKYELPLTFRKYHKVFLFTLLFFSFIVFIGVISSMKDYNFIRSVLGDGYVNMTEENINKGDPFGVYKDSNSWEMFVRIAFNNIRVALLCMLMGLLAGVGSLYMLFENGLMLGSFQYMFFAKGLGWQSILVVWIHGTIEISSIVIAGTAGLILGRGFLFPGSYTRLESFKQAGLDAARIAVGLVPFFIIAAFLEGYITRLTNMPILLSIFILIASACLIIWYFVLYPILLERVGFSFYKNELKFPIK
jgi:uncharacterized membrane protein SpoIIM required for sporulation